MLYFKNPATGEVFAYETTEERDKYGAPDLVEMTEEEINAHLNPGQTYDQALAVLNRAYQADIDALMKAFSNAYLADGTSQDTKQQVIRDQYATRKTQYAADYAALKTQYGV